MKEEIFTLIDVATTSITELESYLFNNLKEKYIISKNILDDHKEHIEKIRGILEYDLTSEEIEMAKHDLSFIIETIKNGRNGLSYENADDVIEPEVSIDTPQNQEIIPQENNFPEIEFSEEDIDALLTALDENEFETIFPQENIAPEIIENSINTLENVIPTPENAMIGQQEIQPTSNVMETDYSNDLDINAIDAFLNPDSQNTESDSQDAFRL